MKEYSPENTGYEASPFKAELEDLMEKIEEEHMEEEGAPLVQI